MRAGQLFIHNRKMMIQEMKAMKKFDSSMQGLFCYICIIASMLLNGLFGVANGATAVFLLCLSVIAFSIGIVALVGVKQNNQANVSR